MKNKIGICTPARDVVHMGYAHDLAKLVHYSKGELDVELFMLGGTLIHVMRNVLVQQAKDNGCTHVLFIDSDVRFPEDALEKLLEHDVDIVGVNLMQRNGKMFSAWKDHKLIESFSRSGLEEVDEFGMGCTLIKLSVFEKLEFPYFTMLWDGETHIGEDVYFCRKARDSGFKVLVDHDLTQAIHHVGTIEFGVDRHLYEPRASEKAE